MAGRTDLTGACFFGTGLNGVRLADANLGGTVVGPSLTVTERTCKLPSNRRRTPFAQRSSGMTFCCLRTWKA
ncbi:hypothetical protein [Micromonospora sp. WMMD980]|uniref:hypothetical protein n=1 Tax=Micromonospora sp. WMMD980 TaxID=3016088 RepID=UPI00241724A0|nr:hypothetical protein [Micromonospora sp. WMMD980]MDG4803765.1 hypothetical protein [Micromonospora sp. WMMD980]